jgi:hypothetical protein
MAAVSDRHASIKVSVPVLPLPTPEAALTVAHKWRNIIRRTKVQTLAQTPGSNNVRTGTLKADGEKSVD